MSFQQADSPIPENASEDSASKLPDILGAKIMMVDDEAIMMDLIEVFLQETGYSRFIKIEDPLLAIDSLCDERPDVLLLDLVMPGMSGFEILERIRKEERVKHMPVIVLTASSDTETKLSALELGATDFLAKPVDPSELALRLRNTLEAKAYQDQLAYYDSVTGLPNRRLFLEQLEWGIKVAERSNTILAVAQIGLSGFYNITNSLGVAAANVVLSTLAKRIESVVRGGDSLSVNNPNFIESSLSHISGDQFSVAFPSANDSESTSIVTQRILEAIAKPLYVEGQDVVIGGSVGISIYPEDAIEPKLLLAYAGTALQQARIDGEGICQFYSQEINQRFLDRLVMENKLRNALANNEFTLFYQPKIDVQSGRFYGVEALIRWNQPEMGMVSPDDFIPLAEETGLITPLGEWIINEACRQSKQWREQGIKLQMAVNVSALQMRNHQELLDSISDSLSNNGIDAETLTIELTESNIMDNIEENISMLKQIQALGCKISIDDFGTGFSSLSYLKRFPIHELKIDRSFLINAHHDSEDAAIVNAIISLAHGLNLIVVSEGIEEREGVEFLKTVNCDLYQGYYCSKPISAEDLQQLYNENAGVYTG